MGKLKNKIEDVTDYISAIKYAFSLMVAAITQSLKERFQKRNA